MAEAFLTGDTFSYVVPFTFKVNEVLVTDLTGWEAESQLRDENGALIADLVVVWLDRSPAVLSLSFAGDTQDWPVGLARIDVQFTDPDGNVKSSKPGIVPIAYDVTRPT